MIYADYNGSSPLLNPVREYVKKRMDTNLFGNPSAIHSISQKLAKGIDRCRNVIAECMGCYPDQIYFNSGSSEGISHVLHSVLEQVPKEKNIIVTSTVEHAVFRSALSYYETKRGFQIKYVAMDKDGKVDLQDLERILFDNKNKVALVSIMAAQNETGVIEPYQELAKISHRFGIEFLCDTTQLIGKGEFHFENSGVDYAVCSGHKLGALSGTGFLMVKEPPRMQSFVFGSSQEKGLRGGTEHYLGIETLAIAVKDFYDNKHKLEDLKTARLAFEAEMKKSFPQAVIIGEGSERLSGTTLIGYPGIHGQAIQIELESHDIFVTTSAACTDNQPETSKVLQAMGVNDQIGRGVIRISLSYSQGAKEYSAIAQALKAAYTKLSKIQSF